MSEIVTRTKEMIGQASLSLDEARQGIEILKALGEPVLREQAEYERNKAKIKTL